MMFTPVLRAMAAVSAAVFVGGTILSGCASTQSDAPAFPTATAPIGNPNALTAVATSEERINDAIAALDGIVQQAMADTGIPGVSVAVVHNGEPAYVKGFGVADVDTGAPVNADTTFQLASVSKPVGASVVSSVVGTGEVSWDDPVVTHLPEFQLSDPWVTAHTTIGDVYAMRSGIPHQAGDDLEELGYDRMQIIERFRLLPLSPFRAQSLYTNFGLTAGAEAVARATGVPWEELSRQRIYEPLGMSRTTSVYDEFLAQDNRATLHVPEGDAWVTNGNRKEQAQAPAGTVSSSANDFAKWMIMELGNGSFAGTQVVAEAALAESRVPRIVSEVQTDPAARTPDYGYGIGIRTDATGRVRYGFSGAYSAGAATHFTLLPSENLGISVFTNGFPLGTAEGIAYEFLDRAETGTTTTDWYAEFAKTFSGALGAQAPTPAPVPSNATPAAPLAAFTGTYANDYYGPAVITADGNGGLVATLGPKQTQIALIPAGGAEFVTPLPDGSGVPSATFTLTDGTPDTVTFVALQAPDISVFRRAN